MKLILMLVATAGAACDSPSAVENPPPDAAHVDVPDAAPVSPEVMACHAAAAAECMAIGLAGNQTCLLVYSRNCSLIDGNRAANNSCAAQGCDRLSDKPDSFVECTEDVCWCWGRQDFVCFWR